MRQKRLAHEFTEFVPDHVGEGVLYVSLTYNTAVHKCCCGCGNDVVTPLSPVDWTLGYDGEAVSLRPSIGNYSFACRSHYWITHGRVDWAPVPSLQRIEEDREADRRKRFEYFERDSRTGARHFPQDGLSTAPRDADPWWRRALGLLFKD